MIISRAHSSKTIISIQNLILIHLMLINLVVQRYRPVSGRFVDHCYSDIGCFPLSDEFYHPRHRPFNVRPWHRSRIKTRFDLYNHKYVDGYELRPWNKINLLHSGFDPLLETKIIIPGWVDNIKRALWVRRLKDSFLWLWQPVNIIVVHWRNFTPYTIATANTRVVGAELANLLKSIEHELHYDRAYYHLIGHSLGAHIGGYCGDRLPGLGRITALDPARPFFQHMPKSVRLDRADARFVDAIHSDFTPENAIFLLMSFGMTTPVGHLDFYPNGPPLLQPGCLRDTILSIRNGIQRGLEHRSLSVAFLETMRYLTACDHQRSHEWFIESITNRQCVFVGVRCNQYEGLINGRCTCDDSRSACAVMGIHADQMYLNNAHEDLWPLGGSHSGPYGRRKRHRQAASIQPGPTTTYGAGGSPYLSQQLGRPTILSKGETYSRLKHHAEQLRKPPMPAVVDAELLDDISSLQDAAFVDYLRANLLSRAQDNFMTQQQQQQQPPLAVSEITALLPDDLLFKRRQNVDDDDDLGLGHLLNDNNGAQQLNEHPKLLSDIDRDIEGWYEDSSRWHLKTNHRPNYCVNQYQVLVFIGPLRTNTGQKHIRANLIISVIGSKGQLLNQRFVPRSANLNSFTMQPFFIILDGTYSLGNILSVAIGWEARTDPEPVQATVSFQSNLLEEVQSMLPTYKLRHPWLSDTIKYDHTGGFQINRADINRPPNVGRKTRKPSQSSRISRRSALLPPEKQADDCSVGGSGSKGHCAAPGSSRMSLLNELMLADIRAPKKKIANNFIDDYLNDDGDDEEEDEEDDDDAGRENGVIGSLLPPLPSDLQTSASERQANYIGAPFGHIKHDDTAQSSHEVQPIIFKQHQQQIEQQLLTDILAADGHITAKLHNIGIHQDHDLENSIVVSQVVISPLQATYGKPGGRKVAKIFCPPHQNYRLHRERTVRLAPNLLGKCHNHQHYLSQPIRVH